MVCGDEYANDRGAIDRGAIDRGAIDRGIDHGSEEVLQYLKNEDSVEAGLKKEAESIKRQGAAFELSWFPSCEPSHVHGGRARFGSFSISEGILLPLGLVMRAVAVDLVCYCYETHPGKNHQINRHFTLLVNLLD